MDWNSWLGCEMTPVMVRYRETYEPKHTTVSAMTQVNKAAGTIVSPSQQDTVSHSLAAY